MYSVSEVMDSRNVAVIGASRDPLKFGALLLKVLKDTGFQFPHPPQGCTIVLGRLRSQGCEGGHNIL